MNFKKTFAGLAAATVAAVSVSAAAGAELVKIDTPKDADGREYVCSSDSMFLTVGYYDGSRDSQDGTKSIVDYGVDWSKAAQVKFIFHITDDTQADFAEGENGIGGAVIVSSNSATDSSHNWNAKDWWGVNDEELGFTAESAKAIQANKIGDYTYELVCPIDDTNSVVDDAVIVQIAIQDWSGVVWWQAAIDKVSVEDAGGAELISWDGTGKCSLSPVGAAAAAPAAEETVVTTTEAPAAEETVVTTTEAPAAGDVQAATDSSKGSPDTGIADVAAVAGIAVLAAGAFVVAKKRK